MAPIILLAFVAVPLIEIAAFIQVGERIGLWPTLAIVIATAVVGTALLRHQGLATLGKAQAVIARGEMPVREVFDGLCLIFAGALLLTPGFVTDTLGLLLFVPGLRQAIGGFLMRRLMARGNVFVAGEFRPGGPQRPDGQRRPGVIDGEYDVVDETGPDGAGGKDDADERPTLPPRG
ncbi:FxsA family protein [Oceanibacterium hippocampi]|uniref:Phage T7 F exclusion suppressor FxsA n=1 Tax=Oceanibacterium hippocampi TaxID=745714 RepID=A0A1Y5RML6_9PROT|nr:FxsA family protein [Oceanibacterium hippocampi]SLN21001.1 phage T7 F exclusion suppressor FxsA [Oceanibacterium hippocampi]